MQNLSKGACGIIFKLFLCGFVWFGIFWVLQSLYCINLAGNWKSSVWSFNLLLWKWRLFQKFLFYAFVDWFSRRNGEKKPQNILEEEGGIVKSMGLG